MRPCQGRDASSILATRTACQDCKTCQKRQIYPYNNVMLMQNYKIPSILSIIVFFTASILFLDANNLRPGFIIGSIFWAAIIAAISFPIFHLVVIIKNNRHLISLKKWFTISISGSIILYLLIFLLVFLALGLLSSVQSGKLVCLSYHGEVTSCGLSDFISNSFGLAIGAVISVWILFLPISALLIFILGCYFEICKKKAISSVSNS